MPIPTEPIGSIPRPSQLLSAMADHSEGHISDEQLRAAQSEGLRETIARLEETGSPVITDGEQTKPSFATYPLAGVGKLAPDGVVIPFADGHTRQLPRLTSVQPLGQPQCWQTPRSWMIHPTAVKSWSMFWRAGSSGVMGMGTGDYNERRLSA
jgi:hypothetical protein